ncbi:MAG: IclR family transcriptional regulator [Aggregatilineales bacterium]|nr:IclR family transcriptional regulator [Chloroflexota bacterium]HPT61259.1 IclR family transcriptional regulator [Bacillota bacterium]
MATSKYAISSAARAFEILRCVGKGDPHIGLSLAEISQQNDLDKSTVYRYLQTLEQLGMVERNDRDNYQLGWGILELAGKYLDSVSLVNVSGPFMQELSERTGETVYLAVPAGHEVIYVSKVESVHSIRMNAQIGTRMPMHCTSLGKAILAHLPETLQARILDRGLPARTPNTITDRDLMVKELQRVRAEGFSVDNIENEEGVRCVGAPIFDYRGKVVGAMSVSGPSNRITLDRVADLGAQVRTAARLISRRLGHIE